MYEGLSRLSCGFVAKLVKRNAKREEIWNHFGRIDAELVAKGLPVERERTFLGQYIANILKRSNSKKVTKNQAKVNARGPRTFFASR